MDTTIAVIDFGSQYTQLIVRRIRELGYYSRLYQPGELRDTGKPAAVILSGGPRSTLDEDAPDLPKDFYLHSLREVVPETLIIAFEHDFEDTKEIHFPFIKKEATRTVSGVTLGKNLNWDEID